MKYFALLFSIYCALLTILPCQDREDVAAKVTHVIIQKSHASSERCNQESCPPFCNCSCCSSARQVSSKAVLTVFTKAIGSTYPGLITPGTMSKAISVWQPPQLG
ncbi:DUF6660 family protein [Pedobacter duraquae]|uniref:Uncharacterized protein n=1 Tax=Pedobacter duraquae TaxID=425511 RepID=A0A4R6INI2_9SPHI|nr:hypothetical protein CLV32_0001 [Pedobacter duraquae]